MADQNNFVQLQKLKLAGSGCTATATSIVLQSMKYPDATNVTMANFGSTGYITLEPGTTKEENISFTGITQNASGTATLTGVTRGLDFHTPYTANTALRQSHAGGAIAVVSNSAPFYNELSAKDNDETVTGQWTFTNPSIPVMDTYSAPTDDEQFATKKYVDDTATGTTNTDRIVVSGTAGATVAAGDFVYLDVSDGEWKLADASTAGTCENVMLGIAQGAGTDGATISGGVLLSGKDSNQTGLTANNVYYLSDTAGDIATSAGTVEAEVGVAISTTEIYFQPKFQTQLTDDQKDALAGTSGTPSASNKFVTDDDTTGTGDVVRSSEVVFPFGGDGTDGALAITTGTTDIDLGGESLVIKNYSSISITGDGKLTFSNPNTNGTTIILKSQGNVTLTSSATPMIDASGMGGQGGAAVTGLSNGNDGELGICGIYRSDFGEGGDTSNGTGGARSTIPYYPPYTSHIVYNNIFCGGGGGSGYAYISSTSGAGGAGGGALIIESKGSLNFTTTNGISVAGEDGGNGSGSGGSEVGMGGGGGAGGNFLCLYNSLTANTGSVDVSGGTGGTSVEELGTGDYYAGGGGGNLIGTGGGGGKSRTADEDGGDGADGKAIISKLQ